MFRRGGHGPFTHFLASVAGVVALVWFVYEFGSIAREALSEPKAQDVVLINAQSLVVTPEIRHKFVRSFVTASYSFMIGGVQHTGSRIFPNREDRVSMTDSGANELAAAILSDGKVRVPHGDPARAFLAYRSAASWAYEFFLYLAAVLFTLILAIAQGVIAMGKWTKAKAETAERRAAVGTPKVRQRS